MKISDKIKIIKKKDIKDGFDLGLVKLNENVFPYSCLIDDDVLLTKNGEVLQMIKILLDDFKLNKEGGLRDAVRKAISENTNDLKTAFWIQTVKRKRKRNVGKHTVTKHEFLKRVYDVEQKCEENLNNYTTAVYITIIRQGRNFSLKRIKDYISVNFLHRIHDKYINSSVLELKQITNNIVKILDCYSPKILSIRKNNEDKECSELLEVLYYIINFKDKEMPIKQTDVSVLLNESKYFFKNGIMAVQNRNSNNLTLAMSFSLKEIPRVNMSNISDIVNNTRSEMIITEYVSYVNKDIAISQFKEQKYFLQSRDDKRFQNDVGLSFLKSGDDVKYNQSSISVTVLAENITELQTFIADAINMFSKHGIVMAREDISLERNYYAMMPANFAFTHRLTIHDASEVGCFCYSYASKECNIEQFLKQTVLFNIGTLKGNIVPIGLDKSKTNVMISGLQNAGKSVMANFLASSIIREFRANICIIEFNCKSRVFIDAIGGQWYNISLERHNHTAIFNALNFDIFNSEDEKYRYLVELFSMLLNANNILITPEIAIEIRKISDNIIEYSKTNKKFALHDVRKILKETSIGQDLECWHSIGQFYHLFDNRNDVFDDNKLLSFCIDDTVVENSSVLALIINHIFINLIQKSKKNKEPMVVILDEPFVAFGNNFFKSKINKMIEVMAENNIYCIFKVANISAESSTIVDFTQMLNSCGLQFHFANKLVDSNYGRVFKLEKLEYMAIKTLSEYEGRNLIVKQRDGIYSCSFDLSDFKKMLKILSDNGETQTQVFKIKEVLQTDSFERWVPAYFSDSFVDSDTIEDRRKIEQELKAIQDIKRLMES